jgi:hypothetical protein
MTDHVTIHLITAVFRRDHHVPESETFMVVHHQGDAADVLGTDEDVLHIDPTHWARDLAAHRGVPFVEPADRVAFSFDQTAGRWYAYDLNEMAADGRDVLNRHAADIAPFLLRSRVGAR